MQTQTIPWLFWLFWGLAFAGFPIGGLLASSTVGPVTTPLKAALAGAAVGAVVGLAEWLVLKGQLDISPWWIAATCLAAAVGMAISAVALGSETSGSPLLWRAAITGMCIGLAQAAFFHAPLPQSAIWVAAVTLGWALAWFITRSAGIDMAPKWAVFGSSGALAYQVITGLALFILLRLR